MRSGLLTTSGLTASLNVLQTLTTESEVANAGGSLQRAEPLGITGVTASTLTITVGTVPQVGYGPVTNTTASPGSVTADLKLNVLGQGMLDIPLSAATGTATLEETVNCFDNAMTSTKVSSHHFVSVGQRDAGGHLDRHPECQRLQRPADQLRRAAVVPPTASTQWRTPTRSPSAPTAPRLLPYSGLSGSSPVYALLTSTLPGVLGPVLQRRACRWAAPKVADLSTNCNAVSIVQ